MNEYRFFLYHADTGYVRIKDPIGWDSLGKTIKRFGVDSPTGLKWHGIFFEYTAKLQFIKDGKKFLQYYYELEGVESYILCRIEKRNPLTRKFEFDYEGKVNFANPPYKVSTTMVEVSLENTGFLQKLKNRMDVKFDLESLVSVGGTAIPAFANETKTLELHSKVIEVGFESILGGGQFPFSDNENYFILPGLQNPLEKDEIQERFDYGFQYSQGSPVNNGKFWWRVKYNGEYTFEIDLNVDVVTSVDPGTRARLKWYLVTGTEAGNYTTTQIGATETYIQGVGSDYRNFNATLVRNLLKNDEVYFYAEVEYLDSSSLEQATTFSMGSVPLDLQSFIRVTGTTTFPATQTKTVLIHEAFTRVMQGITDTADPFRSEYYGRTDSEPVTYDEDGDGGLRAITNGDNIRLLESSIQPSLEELINTAFALDAVGFGIEKSNGIERLRAEPLAHWYQAKRLMRLDFVKDIEKIVVPDMFFNQVGGGIEKWRVPVGTTNNLDEFVAKKEWNLPITQLKQKLEIKSPAVTSGYMIEFLRRESDQPTKDTERDKDIFIIRLRRDGDELVTAKDEAFSSVTGLISPETSYNLEDSPARCLRRHGQFLRASLEKYKDKTIDFSFGEANNSMVSQLTTESAPITENAPISISGLQSPLFLAEAYKIRTELTLPQLEGLNTTDPDALINVFGYVEFSETDKNHKRGWVLEAKPSADSNETILMLLRANV